MLCLGHDKTIASDCCQDWAEGPSCDLEFVLLVGSGVADSDRTRLYPGRPGPGGAASRAVFAADSQILSGRATRISYLLALANPGLDGLEELKREADRFIGLFEAGREPYSAAVRDYLLAVRAQVGP